MTATLDKYQLLIDGDLHDAADGRTFETVSPTTNRGVGEIASAGQEDVNRAVAAARKAFDDGRWSRMTPQERGRRMRKAADLIRERVDELARMETINCGKILVESRADVLNTANTLEYYAGLAGQAWGETIPMNAPLLDYTLREPIGVCAQIIPWNFPLLMAAWKIGPALAMGNTIVLKPASNTPITAIMLGQICLEAGIPDGVLNVLTGSGAKIGPMLCDHPDVDKVAFTGETETGRDIIRQSAGTIKRVSLELGGKSPNIVFGDADIDEAVRGSLFAVFTNAGQRCTARTRLFLHESIYDKFLSDFVAKTKEIRIGDPLEWDTQMGPVISKPQCERILSFVEQAQADGANLAAGGSKVAEGDLSDGNFVAPTVLHQVENQMRIAQEEVFGPVLAVIPFKSDDEVVAMANDTIYGLAATLWTQDVKRAHTVAGKIRAGNVSINFPTVNPPEAPFGGYKQSGTGRELSRHALELYTEVKNVVVNLNPEPFDWYGNWPKKA